ncbi:MAG: hypothetical protein JWL71_3406 [Acidobacteria bacterium]|nr:hypothetical protein [Acidobacteriota bacterium]
MIRSTLVFALVFATLATLDAQAGAAGVCDPHIRSTEAGLLATLADGARVSPTLRRLIDRLNASDVVVYLMFDRAATATLAGHTSLLTTAAGRRYLRVSIDRRSGGCRLAGILGHELQHAVEIAECPAVTDEAGLILLYQRIGFRSGGIAADCFDSAGAILAGRIIEREVAARYREFTGAGR